jgi:hypothetical protein
MVQFPLSISWLRSKLFITLALGLYVIELFTAVIYEFCKKLERLFTYRHLLGLRVERLEVCSTLKWRYHTQYNDTDRSDIQHKGLICDTQHK